MSWLIFALISLLSFAIYDVAGRYLVSRSVDTRVFSSLTNLAITLMSPLILLVDTTKPSHQDSATIILTLIGLTLWALMGRFEYFTKKHVEASTFAITIKIAPVITFMLGIIFLHESLTLSKLSGVALIMIANLFLYFGQKQGAIMSIQGVKYMTILVSVLSVAWLFDAINVKNWGVATFTFLSYLAPFILCTFFPPISWRMFQKELSLTPWWKFIILGFLSLVGYASLLKAYTLGEASSVTPVATSETPFVVLAGVLFLGERGHIERKIVASLLTILAIYLMR